MQPTPVAIVGLGTVGSGVARILLESSDRLTEHAAAPVRLARVVVKHIDRKRDVTVDPEILTDDIETLIADSDVRVVAQLIGGLEPARTYMLRLLESGKDVVTANKALLAEHGPELFAAARRLGRSIAFEASVAGGIPIVANIGQCLSANRIESIHAILNGTSNFILTQMEENEISYADAVADAQARGYAEADPAMDVDGTDAAQKLAILAHIAFGAHVHYSEIPCRGIDTLDVDDLRYAHELGYRIKLLAVARLVSEGLELHVSPTLVRNRTPLAEVRGAYNAVSVIGDAVGHVFYHGLGAGQMPTASAVVADIIDTVLGRAAITFRSLDLWSERQHRVAPRDYDKVPGRFYLRFHVLDQPGVMADITAALGRHQISIASIIQHEASQPECNVVPLVIMTHRTIEGAAKSAVDEIDRLESVTGTSTRMWVRD